MIDDLELPQVQEIRTQDRRALAEHRPPGMDGSLLQNLGRGPTRLALLGVASGPDARVFIEQLDGKFRSGAAVTFTADIVADSEIETMKIDDLKIQELAGRPDRFAYVLTLREFIEPVEPEDAPPAPVPPEPDSEMGILVVEVIVEGEPGFDFSTVTVTAEGTREDGQALSLTLTERANNVWTEEEMPPGQYTVRAVVTDPEEMSGSAEAAVRAGETAQATITLRPGAVLAKAFIVHFWFDKAFVEPCMKQVLARAVEHASDHPDEKLVIVGHCDKTGSGEYNQSLSERRARAVYAGLSFGRDAETAKAEWNELRRNAAGGLPSLRDSWGVREYQYMLQDLDLYQGNVDGNHGPVTGAAVQAFQEDHGLPATGSVDEATWSALIEAYLESGFPTIAEDRLLENCPGERLKWLGLGEQDPVLNTEAAWRPNRRVELLCVRAGRLPREQPPPDTFALPAPGAVNAGWCAGTESTPRERFLSRGGATAEGTWPVEPAEPGTVTVRGSIQKEDGTPLAEAPYVLIAPDGENMDGERASGSQRGRPIPGRTGADGTFSYPNKPKGVGIYILQVQGPWIARLAEDPPGSGRGNEICKRLEGETEFRVIVSPAETGDPRRRLRGVIHDRFGQPRESTNVQVVFADGTEGSALTNEEGEFVIEMETPQEAGRISYDLSEEDRPDAIVADDFFVDVQGIDTDEGLRRRLHNLGYLAGDDLEGAITSFQATHGLLTSGEADAETRSKLAAVHDGTEPVTPEFPRDETPIPPDRLIGEGPPED